MRPIIILFCSLILLSTTVSIAQELHLKDGTILPGTLLSFEHGIYTFSSKTLGKISIPESQVTAVTSGRQQERHSTDQQQLQQIQATILGDETIMALIQTLQNDPDMLAILQDPEIMTAIHNGDLSTLANNPKLQKLMQKSQIKAIKGIIEK